MTTSRRFSLNFIGCLQDGSPRVEVPTWWTAYYLAELYVPVAPADGSRQSHSTASWTMQVAYNGLGQYRPAHFCCQWTTNMEQITCSTSFSRTYVTLVQVSAENSPIPALIWSWWKFSRVPPSGAIVTVGESGAVYKYPDLLTYLLSRFDTMLECDRYTHTDTRRRHIPR